MAEEENKTEFGELAVEKEYISRDELQEAFKLQQKKG